MSCSRGLTLVLRPGVVPQIGTAGSQAPARDIPPGPVIERFPLYPGAVASSATVPAGTIMSLPPAYRKLASAEFEVSAGLQTVTAWYRQAMSACGMHVDAEMPFQRHGGLSYAGLVFFAGEGLSSLTLLFRPLSSGTTAVLYVAQTLDLPPRSSNSLLHGPFTRVQVHYRFTSAVPGASRNYRFTITWPATIARLVTAINAPTRIWVPIGVGGLTLSSVSAVLSFVRQDGGVRKVSVGGVLDRIIVGHTRPLVDRNGRVINLVSRIVHRRCGNKPAC